MKLAIVQTRQPKQNEDLNTTTKMQLKTTSVELPPVILILNDKGNRCGTIIYQRGLALSLGHCYIELNINKEKL